MEEEMESFKEFIKELNQKMGISLPKSWTTLNEVQLAQRFLEKLNEYFFQTYEGIGTTTFNNDEFQYFSEFHKFWEAHHKEILNAQIDGKQAQLAAQALSKATRKYGREIFRVTRDTLGLHPEAVAQVRFFTANQDFREPPENQFGKYLEDPTRFDAEEIADAPEDFLKLSSFLDVFCYQYGYIDEMSARAWRAVWEEWKKLDPTTAPSSPCQMDFLLYQIGRKYCDEIVVQYTCEEEHISQRIK